MSLTIIDLDAPSIYHRFDVAPRVWRESESVNWSFERLKGAVRSPATWEGGGPRTIETEVLLTGGVARVRSALDFLRYIRQPRKYDSLRANTFEQTTTLTPAAPSIREQPLGQSLEERAEAIPVAPPDALAGRMAVDFRRAVLRAGLFTPPRLALVRGSRPGIFRCFVSGVEVRSLTVDEGDPSQSVARLTFTELVGSEEDYAYSQFWTSPAAPEPSPRSLRTLPTERPAAPVRSRPRRRGTPV